MSSECPIDFEQLEYALPFAHHSDAEVSGPAQCESKTGAKEEVQKARRVQRVQLAQLVLMVLMIRVVRKDLYLYLPLFAAGAVGNYWQSTDGLMLEECFKIKL